jgi:hypothetical protein
LRPSIGRASETILRLPVIIRDAARFNAVRELQNETCSIRTRAA